MVGSPTASPFAPTLDPVDVHSQSSTTISSMSRKNNNVTSDTSPTSLEWSSSISLIENVDIEELNEDLIKTKVPLPPIAAYKNS